MKHLFAALAAVCSEHCAFGKSQPINPDDWDWKEGTELGVFARGFADAEPYARIPLRAKGVIADRLVDMGQQGTGVFVDFTTDSNRLAIMWDIKDASATGARRRRSIQTTASSFASTSLAKILPTDSGRSCKTLSTAPP